MNDLFSTESRGLRLKQERKRLKLVQLDAAKIIQVREASWIRYEKYGEPLNQDQIYALAKAGFDMPYVLFGKKNDHHVLIQLYDQTHDDHKAGLVSLAKTFAENYPKT